MNKVDLKDATKLSEALQDCILETYYSMEEMYFIEQGKLDFNALEALREECVKEDLIASGDIQFYQDNMDVICYPSLTSKYNIDNLVEPRLNKNEYSVITTEIEEPEMGLN